MSEHRFDLRFLLGALTALFVAVAATAGEDTVARHDEPNVRETRDGSSDLGFPPGQLFFRPRGAEMQVNSYTTGHQERPYLSYDGFITPRWLIEAVFQGQSQTSTDTDFYTQTIRLGSVLLGQETVTPTSTPDSEGQPLVARACGGDLGLIGYKTSNFVNYNLVAHLFDTSVPGSTSAGTFAASATTVNDWSYTIGRSSTDGLWIWYLDANSFVGSRRDCFGAEIGTATFDPGNFTFYGRYTSGLGAGSQIQSAGTPDAVLLYNSQPAPGNWDVYGRILDAGGVPVGAEFRVNTSTADYQRYPAIAGPTSTGDFLVVWESFGGDGNSYGVVGRRMTSTGPQGSDFVINTYTTGSQKSPAVAVSGDAFLVVWSSSPSGGSIRGRGLGFGAGGAPVFGPEHLISVDTTSGSKAFPAVAGDREGNFVVAWQTYNQDGDGWGVFARHVDRLLLLAGFEAGDLSEWSVASP